MRIVIVGAGLTGLAAAFRLEQDSNAETLLFDGAHNLGGKLQSDSIHGFLVESGPDSVFVRKPEAMDLMLELGLENQIIEPSSSEFDILDEGRLHRVPRALVGMACSDPTVLSQASFLSQEGMERAAMEPHVPRGAGKDESVSSFFRRRFGDEFSRKLAEPLFAGTHSGDADRLSMAALYDHFLQKERSRGCLSGANSESPPKGPSFVSLRGGMATLPTSLMSALRRTRIHSASPIEQITPGNTGVSLCLQNGEIIEADWIVLATSSLEASKVLSSRCPKEAEALRRIRHASSLIVTLGFEEEAFPKLDSTGFLTPSAEKSIFSGCTWSSSKWPDRAPNGRTLIRAFMRDATLDSDCAVNMATTGLQQLLGDLASPILTVVHRWPNALPLYELGHVEIVAGITQALELERISVAGCSYLGTGIPDAIRQGYEAARRAIAATKAPWVIC